MRLRSSLKEATPTALAAVGAVAWVATAVALWRVRGAVNFVDRDDGVITLAHARNLVDAGSVSVGAFGDRVAGLSSPLHFLVGVMYFALGGSGYQLLGRLLGMASLATVGAASGAVVGSELAESTPRRRWLALGGAGALQVGSWSFIGWQFSGMENPLISALLVAVVLMAPCATRSIGSAAAMGLLLGLLAIARLDTITLALPLAGAVLLAPGTDRGVTRARRAAAMTLPFLSVTGGTAATWWWYFGGLGSTTIDNRSRGVPVVLGLVAGSAAGVVALAALLWSLAGNQRTPRRVPPSLRWLAAVVGVGLLGAAALIFRGAEGGPEGGEVAKAVLATGALWAALAVTAAWVVPRAHFERLGVVTAVLLWIPVYAVVLGPTRIHPARVVSGAVPVLSIAIVVVVARLTPQPIPNLRRAVLTGALTGVLALDAVSPVQSSYFRTFYLGWVIEPRDTILVETASRTVGAVDPAIIPIVANPDLGRVAFSGSVQIVDLGKIGDPLLLKILLEPNARLRTAMAATYFFDVMPPDTWMLTEPWSCTYRTVRADPRFDARYVPVRASSWLSPDGDLNRPATCSDGETLASGVFTLRHPERQRDLLLAQDLLTRRTRPDHHYFDACRTDQPEECFARMRAFRRVFPGAREATSIQNRLAGLDATAHGRIARTLMLSPVNPTWAAEAFEALEAFEAEGGG
ncbi:MAG: hypothetical protein R2754_13260 [Microthrixaceae bacterium]